MDLAWLRRAVQALVIGVRLGKVLRKKEKNPMITKSAKLLWPVACCAFLAACGGVPASNQISFDDDGNGRFSGAAGADWTPQEIKTQISGHACGNGPIADFRVSVLPSAPEYTIFSGRCALGAEGLSAARGPQNQLLSRPTAQALPVSTAPVVTTVGNSAGWDGSTPFVD